MGNWNTEISLLDKLGISIVTQMGGFNFCYAIPYESLKVGLCTTYFKQASFCRVHSIVLRRGGYLLKVL